MDQQLLIDQISIFDFSMSNILAGLIFGVIGLWIFRRGRKEANNKIVVIGMLLMVYPMFTNGPVQDWGVGVGLCWLFYFLW
jgi:hypothetical protein